MHVLHKQANNHVGLADLENECNMLEMDNEAEHNVDLAAFNNENEGAENGDWN